MFNAPWLQVILRFLDTEHGQQASCGLWYLPQDSVSGIDPGADMISLANSAHDDIATHFAPVLNTHINILPTYVKLRKSTTSILDAYSDNSPTAGSAGSGSPHPELSAAVLQRRTGLIGPKNRGRIFIPFVPVSLATEGSLGGAAAYRTLAHELGQPKTMEGISWNPVHPNYKDNDLVTIVEWRVLGELATRRDRRYPKRPIVHAATAP